MTPKEYLLRRLRAVPQIEVRVVQQHGERVLVQVGEITKENVAEYFTEMLEVLKHTREMLRHGDCRMLADFDTEVCQILKIDPAEQTLCCHPYHIRRLRWDDGSVQGAANRLPYVVADYLTFAMVDDTPLTQVV